VIHAVVVFVPLLVAAAVAYALVPFLRRWITWAVVGLAVVTPFATWFATLSGNAFKARLIRQGLTGETLVKIDEHREFGQRTLYGAIGLGVLAVVLVALKAGERRWAAMSAARGTPPRAGTGALVATIVITIGVLFFAGVSAYYVYKTGESGARMVWGTS
jgi:hypothetical protein